MIDGVGDRLSQELSDSDGNPRTVLQAANIPNINKLAEWGLCGVHDPV